MNNNQTNEEKETKQSKGNKAGKVIGTVATGAAGIWWAANKDEIKKAVAKKSKKWTAIGLKKLGLKKKNVFDIASDFAVSLIKSLKK